MERLLYASKTTGPWTFDTVVNKKFIGSMREPLVLTTETGMTMLPSTLNYKHEARGIRSSPLVQGRYSKDLVEYAYPISEDHTIYDAKSGLYVVGIEYNSQTHIVSGTDAFSRIKEQCTPEGEFLYGLQEQFPDITFGMLGSWAVDLQTSRSDMDIFIQGGDSFEQVYKNLSHNIDIQKKVGIYPMDKEDMAKYAHTYQTQFQVSTEQAIAIARLRNRFFGHLKNGKNIKMGFSSVYDRNEYTGQTILGSKYISPIRSKGTIVESKHSAAFPREYIIDIGNERYSILSILWTMRRMVQQGDEVIVVGNLRQNEAVTFISLEDINNHIILKQ